MVARGFDRDQIRDRLAQRQGGEPPELGEVAHRYLVDWGKVSTCRQYAGMSGMPTPVSILDMVRVAGVIGIPAEVLTKWAAVMSRVDRHELERVSRERS